MLAPPLLELGILAAGAGCAGAAEGREDSRGCTEKDEAQARVSTSTAVGVEISGRANSR